MKCEYKIAPVNTRRKRYSGGLRQQDSDRNRRDDLPATDHGNETGPVVTPIENALNNLGSTQTETLPQTGLPEETSPLFIARQRKSRQQWTTEQYKDVMWCFYYADSTKIEGGTVKGTYSIWRRRNPDIFPNMNPNTLANQRRFIVDKKKLTDVELQQIKETVKRELQAEAAGPPNTLQQVETPGQANEEVETEQPRTPTNNIREEVQEMVLAINQKWVKIQHSDLHERKKLNKVYLDSMVKHKISVANAALLEIIRGSSLNITQINQLMYATAAVVAGEVKEVTKPKSALKEPEWKRRIQKTIESHRKELALIHEFKKGVSTRQVCTKIDKVRKKYNADITIEMLEKNIQMKLQAKAQRLRRYTKRSNHYHQNKIFNEDAKRFYRQLNNQKTEVTEPPSQDHVTQFWRGILEDEVVHNDRAAWVEQEKKNHRMIRPDAWQNFTVNEIVKVIRKTQNWKSPGPDKVQNFWIKQLSALHQDLTRTMNDMMNDGKDIPIWLTSGTTFLLSKGKETGNPRNYRPITCLPTTYKILTAALTNRIYDHLLRNKILPAEQKGCRRTSRGCKDQLLVSKMVVSMAKTQLKGLGIAWIDYKKAFDSLPHSWILRVMEIYQVCPIITRFVGAAMREWKTEMWLYYKGGCIRTGNIAIKRGIFQGDSLSPLLFCLALIPLTNMLNRQGIGFEVDKNNKINHLFYMDDLKLFAKDEDQLKQGLTIVKAFSDDIKMEFGLEKCATCIFKRGKLVKTQNIQLDDQTVIRNIEMDETYKYLGVEERCGIENKCMKDRIEKEYYRRIRQIMKTELCSKNKITAINTLAVPVVAYSFGIVDWLRADVERLDRKTRKLLTTGGMHHPKADVERLYIKRRNGGRGLSELESAFDASIVGLSSYIEMGTDKFTKLVKEHDARKSKYSLQKEAQKIRGKYLEQETETSRNIKLQLKNNMEKRKIEVLKSKPLHGQFLRGMEKPFVDGDASVQWLRSSGLKGETESLIIAAQDQALNTRYHQKNIMKQQVDSKCRLCNRREEHISHIVAGCTMLASSEYTHRHNKVGSYIHWTMCRHLGAPVSAKYYEHQPDRVVNIEDVSIMWDVPIITDRTILANRPDIVLHNKKDRTCLLIDIAVPEDSNIMVKEAEKLSKYKDLEIEISRMWNCRARTVPIVIGALGTVKKAFDQNLKMLPGHPSASEVQKIALMGTAHILRKVLG